MRLNSWEGQLAAGARRQMAGWDVPAREDAEDGPGPEEPAAAAYPISPVSSATIPVRRRFVSAGGFNGALAMEGRPSFFLSLSLSLSLRVCVTVGASSGFFFDSPRAKLNRATFAVESDGFAR